MRASLVCNGVLGAAAAVMAKAADDAGAECDGEGGKNAPSAAGKYVQDMLTAAHETIDDGPSHSAFRYFAWVAAAVGVVGGDDKDHGSTQASRVARNVRARR